MKHRRRKLAVAFVDVLRGWRVRRRHGRRAPLGGASGRGRGRRLEHGASRGRCRGVGEGIRAAGVPVRVVPRGRERGGRRGDGPRRVAHRRAGLGGRGRLLRGGLSGRRRLRDANEPRALRLAESALDPRRKVHGRACGEGRVVVEGVVRGSGFADRAGGIAGRRRARTRRGGLQRFILLFELPEQPRIYLHRGCGGLGPHGLSLWTRQIQKSCLLSVP